MILVVDNGQDFSSHTLHFVRTGEPASLAMAVARVMLGEEAHAVMMLDRDSSAIWPGDVHPVPLEALVQEFDWRVCEDDDLEERMNSCGLNETSRDAVRAFVRKALGHGGCNMQDRGRSNEPVELEHEGIDARTDRAVLVDFGDGVAEWIPLSLVEDEGEDTITIPTWKAVELGLVEE